MAITYVNDLRLSEMGTGDNSGTWGTVTNTNLELIGEALGFGTEAITTNADTHASTIADGSTDPVRAMYVKYTGTLDSACTITIGPNTVNKFYYIENATSGSQNIIISQGSGANVTIPNGAVKAVYLDGAGSGAAVTDALVDLNLAGNVLITTADNTTQLTLSSTDTDANVGPVLDLFRNVTGATNDEIGRIQFTGKNDAGVDHTYANISTNIVDATSSGNTEDGSLVIQTIVAGSVRDRLSILSDQIVINQEALDLDFRVEGTEPFAFFVNGANSSVQMGGASEQTVGTLAPGRLTLLNDNNSHPALNLFRQDTSIGSGGNLGEIVAYTNDTADNDIMPVCKIELAADGTFGNTDNPSKIGFFTTPDSSETIREVARFDNIGNFRIMSTGGTIYTSTEGTNNLRIGLDAGDAISTGDYNTLLGDEAGTAIDSGLSNIAIGYRALFSEDGHGQNTAIGVGALQTLDAGADGQHIAIGNNAGTALTDAVRNVIIGYNAASAATTPDDCVIIGWEAAHNATLTGHDSVIIGKHAGFNLSSAGAVTIVGMEAGKFSSTGNDNTFIGYNAGYGNTSAHLTGADNTAVGARTGLLLQGSANGNSFFGSHCGDALTTGARNTALGFGALNSEVTGTRTVAVGYNALAVQALNEESHNVAVGYNAGGALTGGNENTFIGYGSGDDTDDGEANVAVGNASLSANCGDDNTAIGETSLKLTTGAGNTAVGKASGSAITSGNKNSILGSYTGNQGSLDIRTLTNNIVLSDGDGNPRMLITSGGDITNNVGNVSSFSRQNAGFTARNGDAFNISRNNGTPLEVNRISGDGTLVQFFQDDSNEGNISVSGSTVSYNGFSGTHESSGVPTNTAIGTVVSTIDELDTYVSGNKSGQTRADHAKIKVSDTEGDKRIYGVISGYTEDDNKPLVASVGIGSVKVTGVCAGGDLLESNGDGTAKVQSDDIIRSKTIGKVTIANSNAGVKLVSCVLYCG